MYLCITIHIKLYTTLYCSNPHITKVKKDAMKMYTNTPFKFYTISGAYIKKKHV